MDKTKRPFLKSKRSFRRWLPPIQLGDRIDYRNMSLISRFISEQGKILSRRVNRLTLKQQRLITIAIKKLVFYLCYLFSIMRNNFKELSGPLELRALEPEIMRNNLKEPSGPPELRALEPEINKLILCSLESEFQSKLKLGLVFCSTNPRIHI